MTAATPSGLVESQARHIHALVAENQRLRKSRDKLVALLDVDPGRAAIAAAEGLRKMLPELKVEEDVRLYGL